MTVHAVMLEHCIFSDRYYYGRGSDNVDDDDEYDESKRKKTDNCELSFVTFLTAKYIKKNGDEEEEEEVKKTILRFFIWSESNAVLCAVCAPWIYDCVVFVYNKYERKCERQNKKLKIENLS